MHLHKACVGALNEKSIFSLSARSGNVKAK